MSSAGLNCAPSRPRFPLRRQLQCFIDMGSDDYAAIGGGGALKLKGAKVQKKKKKKDKSGLEKNLATGEKDVVKKSKSLPKDEVEDKEEEDVDEPSVQKTESERRHDEIKKKRVSAFVFFDAHVSAANIHLTVTSNGRSLGVQTGAFENTQGASRRAQHISLKTKRTSRHAPDWTWLDGEKFSINIWSLGRLGIPYICNI